MKLMASVYVAKGKMALAMTMRSFLAYLVKPRLSGDSGTTIPLSAKTVGACLFIISLVITAVLGVIALPIMMVTGTGRSEQLQQIVTRSIPSVILGVIVLGPLVEEIMFRGWLSGTYRALVGSAAFVVIIFAGALLTTRLVGSSTAIAQIGLASIGLITLRLMSPIDGGKRLPHFERVFPYIFWAQGMIFGVLHFQNVAASSKAIALLATLPLVICAWLWGYARLIIGLRGAILLHAAYNVPAVLGTIALSMLPRN